MYRLKRYSTSRIAMLAATLCAVVVTAGCTSISGHPVAARNTSPFYTAVVDLMMQSAAHYTGSDANGTTWDMRTTSGGEVLGKATSGGDSTDILVVGGKSYVKLPKSKAAANLPRGLSLSDVDGKWLTGSDDLDAEIPTGALSPRELAKRLLQALDNTTNFPRVGDAPVQVGSDQAFVVPTPMGTLAVSATAPYRLLSLTPSPDADSATSTSPTFDPGGGLGGGSQNDQLSGPIAFVLMTPTDRDQAFNDIINQTQTLNNSLDVGINFNFDQSGDINCSDTSCTVTSNVTTSTSSTRSAKLSGNVSAVMRASVTIDDKPSAGCVTTQALPISGSSVMSCIDGSVAPIIAAIKAGKDAEAQAKANAEGHDVTLNYKIHLAAQITVQATAMIQAEIDRIVMVVRTEGDNSRNRANCSQTCSYSQIPYGSDKLSQVANRARTTGGVAPSNNIMVAVVPGWNDPTTGDQVVGSGDTQPDNATGKSEDDLVTKLAAKGFKPDQITGLYSERQPCFSICKSQLAQSLHTGTQVGYSVPWIPNDADSTSAVDDLIKRLAAEDSGAQHK
ncbi:nucleic acid/nucleotide deaminase domain-containing protein [Nocardia sp. NPDC059240]|uniref:nucleic acid/nucleotide deaminase domain-containing protein n=1 Tax=Nocardia sp. NPDC059240 TaxID=3346786 RepID=UPI003694DEB1